MTPAWFAVTIAAVFLGGTGFGMLLGYAWGRDHERIRRDVREELLEANRQARGREWAESLLGGGLKSGKLPPVQTKLDERIEVSADGSLRIDRQE